MKKLAKDTGVRRLRGRKRRAARGHAGRQRCRDGAGGPRQHRRLPGKGKIWCLAEPSGVPTARSQGTVATETGLREEKLAN